MRGPRVVGASAGLLLLALAGGFGWFVGQVLRPGVADGPAADGPAADGPAADGIVALTGGAERVETALRLLASGRARLLLVSGVGGSADLSALGRHAGLSPAELAAMRERITLGRGAASTHGNAVETAEWARENAVGSLVVVTAAYHMPRALAELSRALPAATLYPVRVRGLLAPASWRLLAEEYAKYLAVEAGLPAWRTPLVGPPIDGAVRRGPGL